MTPLPPARPPMTEPTKVQRANVRRWIRALRSGKYRQGRGKLCRVGERYCCLGVAAKLAGIKRERVGHYYEFIFGGVVESGSLPASWATERFGFEVGNGWATGEMAELNDGSTFSGERSHTFAEIADLLDFYLLMDSEAPR